MGQMILGFGGVRIDQQSNGTVEFYNCFTKLTHKVVKTETTAINGHIVHTAKKYRPVIELQIYLDNQTDITSMLTLLSMISYMGYLPIRIHPNYKVDYNSYMPYYDCRLDSNLIIFKLSNEKPNCGLTINLVFSSIELIDLIPTNIYDYSTLNYVSGIGQQYVDGSGNTYQTIQ